MSARRKKTRDPHQPARVRHPHQRGRRAQPPAPLVARLAASQRHPEGLPRCQRWKILDGQPWQCRKAARSGFRVCGKHGAGHASREERGEAINPRLGRFVNANAAKPKTVAALLTSRPELRALFNQELEGEQLLDRRPQLAMAKVLARYFVEQANLEDTDNSFGKTPPALAVIDALNRDMQIAERMLNVEEKLGPITHQELDAFTRAVAETIVEFVPSDRQTEAFAFLRREALRRDRNGDDPETARHNGHRVPGLE